MSECFPYAFCSKSKPIRIALVGLARFYCNRQLRARFQAAMDFECNGAHPSIFTHTHIHSGQINKRATLIEVNERSITKRKIHTADTCSDYNKNFLYCCTISDDHIGYNQIFDSIFLLLQVVDFTTRVIACETLGLDNEIGRM